MVTVSFDFSQIPAQWVAEETPAGSKVVKTAGGEEGRRLRGGGDTESLSTIRLSLSLSSSRRGRLEKFHPGQGGNRFFSSTSLPSFLQFSHLFRRGEGEGCTSWNLDCGKSGGKEGRKEGWINKYVNIFLVEDDSIPKIEDESGTTSISYFEARLVRSDEMNLSSFFFFSNDSRIIKSSSLSLLSSWKHRVGGGENHSLSNELFVLLSSHDFMTRTYPPRFSPLRLLFS